MPITLNGSGTVTGISAGGLPDGVITRPDMGYAGAILQVVQVMYNTTVAVNTGAFTDTGLTATITPTSASNKVLVMVNQQVAMERTANTQGVGIRVLRGVTDIYSPVEDGTGPRDVYISMTGITTMSSHTKLALSVLDSPATTSAVTYKTQGRPFDINNSGVVTFQSTASLTNGRSFMTLLEVAA